MNFRDILLTSATEAAGGGPRTLDLAGSELVTNGQFASDITGWTDASTAGGAIAWTSTGGGRMRVTNTSATARARQTVSGLTIGQRYSYFALNPAGTIGANLSLGSTAPGSNDYLSTLTNASIPARAGVAEITATATSAYISCVAGSAGNVDIDNVTLRQLIPTSFPRGTVFTDDFSLKSDGPLGATPDGLLWREMTPQNGTHVYPYISSGKMANTASGDASGNTSSYPYLDLGNGKVAGLHCDIQWSADAGIAMISVEPTGVIPTVTNIVTNSVHVVFAATQVDIETYVAGVRTTDTVTYASQGVSNVVTDGRTYAGVGWSLSGSTLTVTLPGGTTIQRTDSKFAQVQGACAIPELYYTSAATGPATISKVVATLG